MNTSVRVFSASSVDELESRLNDFLRELSETTAIEDIKYETTAWGTYTALVWIVTY